MEILFSDYLNAKSALDTRSLHQSTWARFLSMLGAIKPLTILDIGSGSCVMMERLFRQNAFLKSPEAVYYWALDHDPELHRIASRRLENLVREFPTTASQIILHPLIQDWSSFSAHPPAKPIFNSISAHAFLDLVNAPYEMGIMTKYLVPGGILYASLNFDGITQWFPTRPEDVELMKAYHADMEIQLPDGRKRSGSKTGLSLMDSADGLGLKILSAGPSDWVILPGNYAPGEKTLILWLLQTIEGVLGSRMSEWIGVRRAQAEAGTLGMRISNWDMLFQKR